jgi:hypothetical protein
MGPCIDGDAVVGTLVDEVWLLRKVDGWGWMALGDGDGIEQIGIRRRWHWHETHTGDIDFITVGLRITAGGLGFFYRRGGSQLLEY